MKWEKTDKNNKNNFFLPFLNFCMMINYINEFSVRLEKAKQKIQKQMQFMTIVFSLYFYVVQQLLEKKM